LEQSILNIKKATVDLEAERKQVVDG